LVALLAALAACTPDEPGPPAPEAGYRLHGRILDAETGTPVSREHAYLHFFCDAIDVQKSFDPADLTSYDVRMPRAEIRIRIKDKTEEYALFEKTVTVDGNDREYDIRLVPTHFVLLRGRAIDVATGQAVEQHGHGPLLYFDAEPGDWGRSMVRLDDDGAFTLRVPRAKLRIQAVDTSKRIANPILDLTGFEGGETEFELRFE
jgi:hypothetical protein